MKSSTVCELNVSAHRTTRRRRRTRRDLDLAPLVTLPIPEGAPLHLERPGNATRLLTPFIRPERLARFHAVLDRRTAHLTVLLDRVHDPHNISACLRSCDAMGIQFIHLVSPSGDPVDMSREVSMGTHRWLTVRYHADIMAAITCLKTEGYSIAATYVGTDAPSIPIVQTPLDTPLCIVFGNEREGLHRDVALAADLCLRIPMLGFVESLNISVACALSLNTLRTKLDQERDVEGDLSDVAQATLLDQWCIAEVPRAHDVLKELCRREEESSP